MHCRKKKQRGPAAASQQLGVLLYISSQKSVILIEFTVKTLIIAHNQSAQEAQSEKDTRCLSSCHHTSIIILIKEASLNYLHPPTPPPSQLDEQEMWGLRVCL